MMSFEGSSKILFISTYPPVKCGLASFTQDLVHAIGAQLANNYTVEVCALDKQVPAHKYKQPVGMVMNPFDLDSCIAVAAGINKDDTIELVCIEHEFGLYGGDLGSFILGFLSLLEKPFVIRFHTVLPTPDNKRLKIVQQICMLADKIIVMTKNSARLLEQDYNIASDKLIIIPHGTHTVSTVPVPALKSKYKLNDKLVLCTFGLLSPNKGIEKGILAMKAISERFPEAMYVVLGQTHPNLKAQEGEKYREYLQQLINENGLQNNVRLVNEYVPVKMLMEYLALTDIYLFTSKDPHQAVSGTFLYAMSAGCPIISNSFVLAKEMLDESTGIILQTDKEEELAMEAIALLENEPLRRQMGQQAFTQTRDTTWTKVSRKHTTLFCDILGIQVATYSPPVQITIQSK
jgi:glycosyltransferase involved in cell wall biosynthesis